MKNYICLNSTDWCDIVFEKRNKEYGAYILRQESWKIHLIAFLCTIAFTATIAVTPSIVRYLSPTTEAEGQLGHISDDYNLSKIDQEKRVEIIIPDKPLPEPPKLALTIKFVPPTIVPDEEVTPENQMKTVEDILESSGIVATVDNANGSKDRDAIIPKQPSITDMTGQGKKQEPFVIVEVMPQFPGGEIDMMNYIGKTLRYPASAIDNGIHGRVVIRFVVDEKGIIDNVQILKGIDSSCDKEAMRVIKSMPRWISGKQNGRPVAVYFTLPILFRLK